MKIPPASRTSHRHHDGGFHQDLRRMNVDLGRRSMLGMLAGATLLPLFGCTTDGGGTGGDPDLATAGSLDLAGSDLSQTGTCAKIPAETEGPYPGDGTNGPNVLTMADVVRADIRSSIGGATGVAAGVLLTVSLKLVDTANGCAPLAGRAIYLWHCDAAGNYSMYSAAAASENYLRGVQVTDANGGVSFTTIFPGCYPGRWPHMHFEIFSDLATATSGTQDVRTSQLAFPKAACDLVYAGGGYPNSAQNLSSLSIATDGIFKDGSDLQVAATSGDVAGGLQSSLTIGV